MVAEASFEYGEKKRKKFPYGLYFGSKIRDSVKNRVGCVVGINDNYVLVAFEDEVEPQIVSAGSEFFENGYYSLA